MRIIYDLFLTTVAWWWLWFMVKKPEKWVRFVDSSFWEKRGMGSAWAERFVKGRGMKILIGTAAVIGSLATLIRILTHYIYKR
jgi:hypothetical protein